MEKLFKEYYAALCLFSTRIVKDELIAEDIVQEAFIKLKEQSGNKEIRSPRSWLYTVVKNASLSALKEKKKIEDRNKSYADYMQVANNSEPDCEYLIIKTETSRQLWNEVQKLPAQMRQVIRMHFFESMSVKEISLALHQQVGAITTQKRRGIARLRKYLALIILVPIISFFNFF